MKNISLIILLSLVIMSGNKIVFAQDNNLNSYKITANYENIPLGDVFNFIHNNTEVSIVYADNLFDGKFYTGKFYKASLRYVLDKVLDGQYLYFAFLSDQLTIYKKLEIDLRSTVIGKVLDSNTGKPLINADVYFANTMKGASTNLQGEYSIRNVEPGIYNMIVSYVGYKVQSKQVTIDKDKSYRFNFKLVEKEHRLDEVIINGKKPKDWKKNLKLFTKYLLGNSKNAKKTKILNPFVLGFNNDKKNRYFSAKADDILNIENKALGYILHYNMSDFVVEGDIIKFLGEPYFEKMIPKNKKELKQWEENREKAYIGSISHFLKSLIDQTTFEDGFAMKITSVFLPDTAQVITIKNLGNIYKNISDNKYELFFNDHLNILYEKKEKLTFEGNAPNIKSLWAISNVQLFGGKQRLSAVDILDSPVLFDKHGYLYNPYKLLLRGRWGIDYRVPNLLPREYLPNKK